MIRKVSVRGNRITIEWDQEDYDFFFHAGLQAVADEHFGGKRTVVVVPVGSVSLEKKVRTVSVSDGFADMCVGKAVNQALKEHVGRLGRANDATLPSFVPPIGHSGIIHKAVSDGEPDALCGVRRPRATAVRWEEVDCPRCRRAAKAGKGAVP